MWLCEIERDEAERVSRSSGGERKELNGRFGQPTESESLIKIRNLPGGKARSLCPRRRTKYGCQQTPFNPLSAPPPAPARTPDSQPSGPVIYYSQLSVMEFYYIRVIIMDLSPPHIASSLSRSRLLDTFERAHSRKSQLDLRI